MRSSLASFIIAARKALDAAGVDGNALLRQAGIEPALLADPIARIPIENTARLWRLAVDATGDSAFGLKVASQITPTSFRALSFALLASDTLQSAFERVVRYFRVVSDAADLELQQAGEEVRLHLHIPSAPPLPADEGVDAFVAMFVRMCRARLGKDFAPIRVELRRPVPTDLAAFEQALRCPLRFGAEDNLIVFKRADFQRPLEGGDADLARHNEEIVQRTLAQLERSNVVERLRAALIERLPQGEPSAEGMAALLHLSERSLQRKLAEQGSSYREVLDTTRRELAQAYLKSPQSQYSLTEITFLLGFADTRSFGRACSRWFGMTPSAYRAG